MPHVEADAEPWTLAVDDGGDIIMTENQTPALVRGENATVQDLKVALDSYSRHDEADDEEEFAGDDPRDPEFGLDVFSAVRSYQALKREIRRTLEYDDYRHDRVDAVRQVQIVEHGSRDVTVHVTIALGPEPTDLTLVFDLFSGTLNVHGGDI